jgi:hypothetical protein
VNWSQWVLRFSAEMTRRWGITSIDAGIDAAELRRWMTSHANDPEGAARDWGDKYDLFDFHSWRR